MNITTLRAIALAQRMRAMDFSTTLMLGRQEIFFTKDDFDFCKRRSRLALEYDNDLKMGQFSEGLFRKFGAMQVDSVDASNYEGASIVADFNRSVPEEMHGKYSMFIDFGSIEHIYNIPQVIDNIARLLKPQGTAFIMTQANGYAGHGFYQFSPEFFYSVFSEQNGFRDTVVFLVDLQSVKKWHLVPDPMVLGKRNDIPQSRTYFIFSLSTKVADVSEIRAQQSDYESDAWKTSGHSHMGVYGASVFSKARHLFNPFLFQSIRGWYYSMKSLRDFHRQPLLFDPDLITKEEFARLRTTR